MQRSTSGLWKKQLMQNGNDQRHRNPNTLFHQVALCKELGSFLM